MEPSRQVVGTAVLRDFPLRLWAEAQEHSDGVLREFALLLLGQEQRDGAASAPAQLVALAEMFTTNFGQLLDAIQQERLDALARGEDRIDSQVPMIDGTPELLGQVEQVLTAVDEYCQQGALLALARPPEVKALTDWTLAEVVAQYGGAEPRPWPGPF
jgi:hypothetical protein